MQAKASKKKDICVAPGCKSQRHCRGLCCACYFEARRRISAKTITEDELIKRKLMLPSQQGRRSNNALAKACSR